MQFIQLLRRYPLRQNDDFISKTFRVAIPMVLQELVVSLVSFLDNLMVGQLGTIEISGVGASSKYLLIAFAAMMGISAASGAFISQYQGAGKPERVRQSYQFSLLSMAIVCLLMIQPAIWSPKAIGTFFTHDPAICQPVADYMPLAAIALIPQIYSFSAQNAMRCLGETRLPFYASSAAVFFNAFFNWILIFGHLGAPAMGVKGAALGTLIARSLEMFLTMLMVRKNHFVFAGHYADILRIPSDLVKSIAKRAFPLTINEVGFGAGMALLFKFYGTRGSNVLAAMNIMGSITDIFFILFSGMAVANTLIVGQALGANRLEEARSNAYRLYKLSFLLGLGFASLMFLSSFIFPHFFNVDPETREMAIFFIRIYSVFYIIYTINTQTFFTLRSGGDARHTLIMDSGWFWLVNLPVVGLATYLTDWPVLVLFFLGQMTDFFKAFLAIRLLMKEHWLKNLTLETDHQAAAE